MDPESFNLLMGALKTIAQVLKVNEDDSHALLSDDMLIWFRNLGFVKDERFKKACEGFESSAFIRAKLYRVYTYCWAVDQATYLGGVAIDLGSYDAKTVQIANKYAPGLRWYLFDAFEYHPSLGSKEKHGPDLVEEVRSRLPDATVVDGLLPWTLAPHVINPISFVHVDLNNGKTEVECLEMMYDYIVPGGVILLDDHGWSKFHDSYEGHTKFFQGRGQSVLEIPTGQGLVIKR